MYRHKQKITFVNELSVFCNAECVVITILYFSQYLKFLYQHKSMNKFILYTS